MGSKDSIAHRILPIILQNRVDDNQPYVEPFCGGCNVIDKVSGRRIANDSNNYLIALWRKLVYENWQPPHIDKQMYLDVRRSPHRYPDWLVGYIGFVCSFRGKWFGGYRGNNIKVDNGTVRNYQTESKNSMIEQIDKLRSVEFTNCYYDELDIPDNAIVYCDPPYTNTTEYANKFDHKKFWQWARELSQKNNNVYISESQAPDDFEIVWLTTVTNTLGHAGANREGKKPKRVTLECLFKYKG